LSSLKEDSDNRIQIPELISFLLAASLILGSGLLFFQHYLAYFIVLTAIDGLSTFARVRLFLALDRSIFALSIMFMTAILSRFTVVELILEVLLLISIIDMSMLLQKLAHTGDPMDIIRSRLRSYIFTIVPSAVFSVGMIYIYSVVVFFPSAIPQILELGFAATGVFVLLWYFIRLLASSGNSKNSI
jgi:hypothetical protein